MMRLNEAEHVVEMFTEHLQGAAGARGRQGTLPDKLAGVTDPERKRKIIGEEFIRCFEEEARKLTDAPFLVQGTLYSDVIESGTRQAAKIKSHHNVGGLPEKMGFELVEPLRLLFKDEVRAVGEELGLPERIVWRQPFPGPGLGIRIIGEVTAERVDILQRADAILQEEIKSAGLYRELWQCFAILPVIRSVGVQGDERTYAYPIAVRAVKSDDAMTADWARLPYDLLERSHRASSTKCPRSTASSTTSRASRRAPSSGSRRLRSAEAPERGRERGARPLPDRHLHHGALGGEMPGVRRQSHLELVALPDRRAEPPRGKRRAADEPDHAAAW